MPGGCEASPPDIVGKASAVRRQYIQQALKILHNLELASPSYCTAYEKSQPLSDQ